jgi:hypothetical protein
MNKHNDTHLFQPALIFNLRTILLLQFWVKCKMPVAELYNTVLLNIVGVALCMKIGF